MHPARNVYSDLIFQTNSIQGSRSRSLSYSLFLSLSHRETLVAIASRVRVCKFLFLISRNRTFEAATAKRGPSVGTSSSSTRFRPLVTFPSFPLDSSHRITIFAPITAFVITSLTILSDAPSGKNHVKVRTTFGAS